MKLAAFVPAASPLLLLAQQQQQFLGTKFHHSRSRLAVDAKHRRTGYAPARQFPPLFATSTTMEEPFGSTGSFVDQVGHSIIASNAEIVDLSMTTTTTTTMPARIVEFEPVLNLPAFGTFLFIAIVFGLLQIRTSQVEAIVQERNRTMANLRALKSQQVSGGSDNPVDPVLLQAALDDFERAVQTEERLRNIIPGVVRIVPPSAANDAKEQEARRTARQFLGKDYDIGKAADKEEELSSSSKGGSKRGGEEDRLGRGLPPSAVVVLVVVFVSQLALLLFLSQDPMASSGGSNNMMMTTSATTNFF